VRIIAGEAKGRRLRSPRGSATRPMMDRVREAVFSSLGAAVVDARVIDLYAGSGTLGLESLSRGARSAVFVESGGPALRALRHNVDLVGLGGTIVASDVDAYLDSCTEVFDLAFVDPPYEVPLPSVEHLLGRLADRLATGAIAIVHRRVGSGDPSGPPGLSVTGRRRYGTAEIIRLAKE
jgi:16S rRNA (guanine966-N2)-methyltransferase